MNKYQHQYKFEIEKLPTESDVVAEFEQIMLDIKKFNVSVVDVKALIALELIRRVSKHIKLSVNSNDVFNELNSLWINKAQSERCFSLPDTNELNSLWINKAQFEYCFSLQDTRDKKKACDCVSVGGGKNQQDGVSCVVSGCNQNSDSYFKEILDQRQKEIEYLKNNKDWQLAAPLGELILITPEINSLLMKALEERGVKPTPYHIHTLATLIQQLSGAAL
ncbi:hypothetical protein D3C81_565110 [compost metagenome]